MSFLTGELSPVQLMVGSPTVEPDNKESWAPPGARLGRGRLTGGRGLTRAAAMASCLGETAEFVSALVWGDEPLIFARVDDCGESCLNPGNLLLCSDYQYATRDAYNKVMLGLDHIPARLPVHQKIAWSQAFSLEGIEQILVPAGLIYTDYLSDIEWLGRADSTGCAAGPNIEAAIVSAFLELVERDAVAIWWYAQHRLPRVCIRYFESIKDLVRALEARTRRFSVLDATSDLAIPTFIAISFEPDGSLVALGASANFDPELAVSSAITEMLQIEVSLRIRKATGWDDIDLLQYWIESVSTSLLPFLVPAGTCLTAKTDKVENSIERCSTAASNVGLKAYFINLSRDNIGVPVVRVVVPGMRSLRPRFAPGRLYDVPVKLGWRGYRAQESQMNHTFLSI
jgi:ribosomal protein S12 methylthiotransferase accessory factor